MAFLEFKEALTDIEGPEHEALVSHVRGLINRSRECMSKNYTKWDENYEVFKGKRKVDEKDRKAEAKGEPKKLVMPLTFSQVMTFVAFNMGILMQNRRFFELEPVGTSDNPLREGMEILLERDLRKNKWQTFLVQFFLDIGRFTLGVGEVGWEESYRKMRVQQTEATMGAFGEETETVVSEFVDLPVFIGNKITSVSPYRFYPDTSLPLCRYQEGEFCGSEDVFTLANLKRLDLGLINLDKIPKLTEEEYEVRKNKSRIPTMETRKGAGAGMRLDSEEDFVKKGDVIVTKCVVDITPDELKVRDDGEELGEEEFALRYVVWYANDATIIRFEEATYLHGMFPYIMGQYIPDQHDKVPEGLADICGPISDTITWLINAHVESLRTNIKGKFAIDMAGVDPKSVLDNGPFLKLKRDAAHAGVDRYIKQFQTVDPTAGFMKDAGDLKTVLGEISGYNETMHGQYSQGRRSATQDRVVAQSGSARGKAVLGGIWDSAFEPLGKQLLCNNRQEMSEEMLVRVLETVATPDWIAMFKADALAIASQEDFFVFDATIPSEKSFLAQSLQEIFVLILQNPAIAQVLGFGPEIIQQLFRDIYNLRGVTPSRLPTPMPMAPGVVPMLPAAEPTSTVSSNGR